MEEESMQNDGQGLDLPAGTSAPLYLAVGLALMLVSLVTNVIFAYAGLGVALWGAVGWWREIFPHERKEFVPAQSMEDRAPEVVAAPGHVRNLVVGQGGHRVRLPLEYHPYSAGIRGGIVGGLAMAGAAAIYGLITQGSAWSVLNGFGAIVLPIFGVVPSPDQTLFHPAIIASAAAIHIVFSLLIGLVYASVLPMLPGHPRLWGGLVAPLLWTGAGFVSLELVEPGAGDRIDWFAFIALQIIFGMTAGEVISRSERVKTLQSFPLVARAGFEVDVDTDIDGEGDAF
jgi:hypothetical protein